jgi:hypothetical protein
MSRISIERLEEIEFERQQVINNPKFQEWMKELNVSNLYYSKSGLLKAKYIIDQYDYSNYVYKVVV